MIAVICDDFTGAAELAGITLRYGLSVKLCLKTINSSKVDVLVICTDSRSMNTTSAESITASTITQLKKLQPTLIFKKIDSVFRGHVLEELRVQMKIEGRSKALVVAANPSLGRTIRNGHYYINDQLLHTSGFSTDPDFPVMTSNVVDMFAGKTDDVEILPAGKKIKADKITIGEVASRDQMKSWAQVIDNSTTAAGGGDFFEAILQLDHELAHSAPTETSLPFLFVSGTTFNQSRNFIKKLASATDYVAYLSKAILESGNANDEDWIEIVITKLKIHGKCIIAVDEEVTRSMQLSFSVKNSLADAVIHIMNSTEVKELFVEGGATAAAILEGMDCKLFEPVSQLSRGVVRMKSLEKNFLITVKPGSYAIAESITKMFES